MHDQGQALPLLALLDLSKRPNRCPHVFSSCLCPAHAALPWPWAEGGFSAAWILAFWRQGLGSHYPTLQSIDYVRQGLFSIKQGYCQVSWYPGTTGRPRESISGLQEPERGRWVPNWPFSHRAFPLACWTVWSTPASDNYLTSCFLLQNFSLMSSSYWDYPNHSSKRYSALSYFPSLLQLLYIFSIAWKIIIYALFYSSFYSIVSFSPHITDISTASYCDDSLL